jgi:rubrerythrin
MARVDNRTYNCDHCGFQASWYFMRCPICGRKNRLERIAERMTEFAFWGIVLFGVGIAFARQFIPP